MDNNFDEVKAFFAKNGFGQDVKFETENKFNGDPLIRLDVELWETLPLEEVAKVLIDTARVDLMELAVDGDTENKSDPLLKTMDGAKKLKKAVDFIEITNAAIYPEYNWRKDTQEYTMFLRVRVTFK